MQNGAIAAEGGDQVDFGVEGWLDGGGGVGWGSGVNGEGAVRMDIGCGVWFEDEG